MIPQKSCEDKKGRRGSQTPHTNTKSGGVLFLFYGVKSYDNGPGRSEW